jgi:hypothetical protein
MADRSEPEAPPANSERVAGAYISYASQDKAVADAVCQALERRQPMLPMVTPHPKQYMWTATADSILAILGRPGKVICRTQHDGRHMHA